MSPTVNMDISVVIIFIVNLIMILNMNYGILNYDSTSSTKKTVCQADRVKAVVEAVVEDCQNEYVIWPSKIQLFFLSVLTFDYLKPIA